MNIHVLIKYKEILKSIPVLVQLGTCISGGCINNYLLCEICQTYSNFSPLQKSFIFHFLFWGFYVSFFLLSYHFKIIHTITIKWQKKIVFLCKPRFSGFVNFCAKCLYFNIFSFCYAYWCDMLWGYCIFFINSVSQMYSQFGIWINM